MQYVKLDLGGRAYTYAWPGEPLNTGDWVRVPGNSVNPREGRARVLRVLPGPDYDGPITEILGRHVVDEQPCLFCQEADCRGGCLL